MEPVFKIFIGYDPKETVAYHVLSHSILSRATCPVSITPLRRESLPIKPRGALDSTEFATSRFLVPYLCDFKGTALFMDCDMLVLDNVHMPFFAGLSNLVLKDWAVACVQHDYKPKSADKFLGQKQTIYPRKNWSSFMLFDCEECSILTPDYVNKAPGLELHQFKWTEKIGSLDPRWNNLIGEECELPIADSYNLHFTRGGPWFKPMASRLVNINQAINNADMLWELEMGAMLKVGS